MRSSWFPLNFSKPLIILVWLSLPASSHLPLLRMPNSVSPITTPPLPVAHLMPWSFTSIGHIPRIASHQLFPNVTFYCQRMQGPCRYCSRQCHAQGRRWWGTAPPPWGLALCMNRPTLQLAQLLLPLPGERKGDSNGCGLLLVGLSRVTYLTPLTCRCSFLRGAPWNASSSSSPTLRGDALFGTSFLLEQKEAPPPLWASVIVMPAALDGAIPSLEAWHKEKHLLFSVEWLVQLHRWHCHKAARVEANLSVLGILQRIRSGESNEVLWKYPWGKFGKRRQYRSNY